MKTIYIVGFEGYGDSNVSGFDWFLNETNALIEYEKEKNQYEQTNSSSVAYYGEFIVSDSLSNAEITNVVEAYLQENDFDNAPLKNKQISKRV